MVHTDISHQSSLLLLHLLNPLRILILLLVIFFPDNSQVILLSLRSFFLSFSLSIPLHLLIILCVNLRVVLILPASLPLLPVLAHPICIRIEVHKVSSLPLQHLFVLIRSNLSVCIYENLPNASYWVRQFGFSVDVVSS